MSWPLAAYGLLGLALAVGFGWYERSRPDARVVALVGTLAAFAALGRIAFAAVPNVKPTSDIVLLAGFALGAGPGFAVGAVAGLTSNFFFGQGPWTPWQMAAWGLTGVLGALLGRASGGRIGRWPLALVCAGSGFAFTAVQDAGDWVTYSDRSLGSLGAYVGQGLGFDGIYAAACLGFALAFGPALLRSIQRFARRVEVTWVDVDERSTDGGSVDRPRASAPLVCAAAATLCAVGAGAWAVSPGVPRARAAASPAARAAVASPAARAAVGSPVARAAAYLRRAENPDGGLGAAPGQPSNALFAGWGALGLSAAGVDVAAVRARAGAPSLLAYVARGTDGSASAADVGALERTILALRAAGVAADGPARRLAGAVAPSGAVDRQVNLTAFAVLALRAADAPGSSAVVARSRAWLAGQGDRDGGYGFSGRGGASDPDDTGAVLEALGAAPGGAVVRARRRAVAYLRRVEDPDGGFPDAAGAGSNAQSTAWAVQGLIAAGAPPRSGARGPLAYLRSLQTASGSIDYARGESQTPVWVTGEALMALAGRSLPVVGPTPRAAVASSSRRVHVRRERAPASRRRRRRVVVRAARPRHVRSSTRTDSVPVPVAGRAAIPGAIERMESAVAATPARVIRSLRLGG